MRGWLIPQSRRSDVRTAADNGTASRPAVESQAPAEPNSSAPGHSATSSRPEAAFAVAIIGLSTIVALVLRPYLVPTNLAMVYLLGVVAAAMRCSRRVSVITSFVSVAAFDFFCVPPYLTFRVADYEYLITFAGMLVVALVISTQTARIRTHAAQAAEREARTESLYRLSRRLAGQKRVFDVARVAAECAEEVFQVPVVIFLPDEGRITFRRRTSDHLPVSTEEETVAQWVFDHGQTAAKRADSDLDSAAIYLPLSAEREVVGVMGVLRAAGRRAFAPEQTQLLEAFANQTALAIERTRTQHAVEEARMQVQTEEMRSSLLSAVSHDLRTPLASITGAASALRSQAEKLPPHVRQELLDSIADEAQRLSRLVSNLLDMTRLETSVELRRDLYPLEEIVGAALQRMERQLGGRQVTTHLPDSLPLVHVDDVLLGQVILNLLENAVKYSPAETGIEVAAEARDNVVIVEVKDRGPGFAPGEEQRVFEKFYRGRLGSGRGAGLGLAICRAIVEAHEGTIEALNRPGGGAILRTRLPIGRNQ